MNNTDCVNPEVLNTRGSDANPAVAIEHRSMSANKKCCKTRAWAVEVPKWLWQPFNKLQWAKLHDGLEKTAAYNGEEHPLQKVTRVPCHKRVFQWKASSSSLSLSPGL